MMTEEGLVKHITMTIDGKEYVAVPAAEYRALKGEAEPDAADWAQAEVGRSLRAARKAAGLSQEELAHKMRKSQTLVSRIEAGEVAAGERYVAAVLRACGLPKDWAPTDVAPSRRRRASRRA